MDEKPLTAKELPLKQARFVELYCGECKGNASEAYRKAYPNCRSGYNAHGSRLMTKDSIKQAIAAKRAELAAETGRTVAQLDTMYVEDRELARSLNQPSAAVSATTGIAKLYGLDKQGTAGSSEPHKEMSPDELAELRDIATEVKRRRALRAIKGVG